MKIRKFNESINVIDLEYVKDCFVDIIDEGFKIKIEHDIDDDGKEIKNYCTITIYTFSSSSKFVREKKHISDVIETFEKMTEMVKDLDVSIDKVIIKYPDLTPTIWLEPTKIDIMLHL